MSERTEIAKTLRKLRLERELTQDDVSKVLGIQRTTYTKYEKDHKPEISILIRLAEFYSVSLDEMLSSVKKKVLSSAATVCSPHLGDDKLEMWEPGELSKDEKRLLQLFRFCKSKKRVIEAAQKIVADDVLVGNLVEDLHSES